jgi:hypothetical protein
MCHFLFGRIIINSYLAFGAPFAFPEAYFQKLKDRKRLSRSHNVFNITDKETNAQQKNNLNLADHSMLVLEMCSGFFNIKAQCCESSCLDKVMLKFAGLGDRSPFISLLF